MKKFPEEGGISRYGQPEESLLERRALDWFEMESIWMALF